MTAVANLILRPDGELNHRAAGEIRKEKRPIVSTDGYRSPEVGVVVEVSEPILRDRRVFPARLGRSQGSPFNLNRVQALATGP